MDGLLRGWWEKKHLLGLVHDFIAVRIQNVNVENTFYNPMRNN